MSDGVIRRPIGRIDYWAREAGGAAAVIRAFWCGLAERKGHPLNISGRTTTREIGRGGQTKGTVPKCDDHDWQGHVPTDAEIGWKDSSGSSKFCHFFSVLLICGENSVKTEVIQEIWGYSTIEILISLTNLIRLLSTANKVQPVGVYGLWVLKSLGYICIAKKHSSCINGCGWLNVVCCIKCFAYLSRVEKPVHSPITNYHSLKELHFRTGHNVCKII